MRTPALERAVQRGRRASSGKEACALCASPTDDDHPHLLDRSTGLPICVCGPCSVLFDRPVAAGGRYRRVPGRRRRVAGLAPATLRVPVGLAFFIPGDDGPVTAHYPSPGGATRWDVEAADWAAALDACPDLADLAPEVEALLVNTGKGTAEAWIVPVTDCYRLVATVREHWEGLSGGDRVWKAVAGFFDELRTS